MRTLLRKNLSSHKEHNFLTSIVYSLALACAIFLLVTANIVLQNGEIESKALGFEDDTYI